MVRQEEKNRCTWGDRLGHQLYPLIALQEAWIETGEYKRLFSFIPNFISN